MRRSEGISSDALDETDVDASWETWETKDDDDGKLEFYDVHGSDSRPRRCWHRKKEELQIAEGLDAWEMKPRSDAMRHKGASTVRHTMARPQQRVHIQT